MIRLTKKVENQYIIECPDLNNYIDGKIQLNEFLSAQDKGTQKLGQLEDLEEDLGIDLITLFKALKNGIWVKTKKFSGFIEPTNLRIAGDIKDPFSSKTVLIGLKLISYRDSVAILAKNYGKHWALTKEELL